MSESSARTTFPILSKYEKATLLAARAAQISSGSPITVRDPGTNNPLEIARLELNARTIPYKIQRKLPNGSIEEWDIKEMDWW